MRIKGWKNVFAFTFIQQIKTKSFIIGTVIITLILAVIAALANILPAVILKDEISDLTSGESGSKLSVETLYVSDETGLGFDSSGTAEALGLKLENLSHEQAEAKMQELSESAEAAMTAVITRDEDGLFVLDSRYAGENSSVKRGDCQTVSNTLASSVRIQFLSMLGVPEEEIPAAVSNVSVSMSMAGEEPTSFIKDIANTIVPMLSSVVLFIFIFSYSQMVAQSVAIEKSSRIMEYLLTSIKPLAIIMGKVLAMCCVSLLQFIILLMGGAAGFLISMPFGIFSQVDTIVQAAASADSGAQGAQDIVKDIIDVFSSINFTVIIVMIATFILGFLLYALIAGLAGASVSKMEDLASAMQPISIIGVLGFYLAYFPQVSAVDGGENFMMTVARYLPISSPFILTSDYMLGKIGGVEALVSILVIAAADVLLMLLVAKVYEHIVLHTGKKLSISDMLKLAK